MLNKILFGGESGLSPLANAGFAILRIFAGTALALTHGINKMPPSEGFVETAGKLGFPMPVVFAWAAGFSEFLGGIFLALGLFTRVSSFFIASTMLVAVVGVHRADPFQKQELAFLYFFIGLAFLLKGSGDWSLDRFLRRA